MATVRTVGLGFPTVVYKLRAVASGSSADDCKMPAELSRQRTVEAASTQSAGTELATLTGMHSKSHKAVDSAAATRNMQIVASIHS